MEVIITQTLALLVVAIAVAIAARRLALPYTVGLVIAGIALAFSRIDIGIVLTHDIIFDLILPPLLFEAAINIHWRELRRDAILVLVISIVGVVISALFVFAGMQGFLAWPVGSALMFGVLISATDPVAVIAMFKDTGIKGRLRLLVESESLFNDGVAAVLFALALNFAEARAGGAGEAAGLLAIISGGGIALGLAVGAIALLVTGRTQDRLVEAAVTCVAAYGSFLMAESFHFSGVLATVSAGLVIGSGGLRPAESSSAVSGQGRAFVLNLWDFLAFLANSVVFLLIGLTVARIPFAELGFAAICIAILLTLLGRAATVYPLAFLFRRSRWSIGMKEQHVLWWGGLRGALALALALSLPPSLPFRDAILIATFAVVTFSVVGQGLTMPALLRRMKLLPAQ